MKLRLFLCIILFTLIIENAVSQKTLLRISNMLDSVSNNFPWINQSETIIRDTITGNYYSSTNSIKQFGLGYKGFFPLICRNKNLHISFNEQIRTNIIGNEFFMVINISMGDSVIVWESKNISSKILEPNTWTEIKEEIEIPSTLTGEKYIFAVYLWNKDGKSIVDIDDFKIDFKEKEFPSFLPKGFIKIESNGSWKNLLTNSNYSFFYNEDARQLRVLNAKGDTLINSLALFSEWFDLINNKSQQFWNNKIVLRKDSATEEGNYIIFSVNDDVVHSEITILAGIHNNLSFNIRSVVLRSITLFRHSLVVGFSLPLSGVYKKSTLIDTTNFKNEYWLDKEGFSLSNGQSTLVLYRPQDVSSIQLDVKKSLAIINLDYSADHPLLHFPLLQKNENKMEDRSASYYTKGSIIKSSFTFYAVKPKFKIAQLLTNPYGYLSSFIWTEHADYTDLRTHKAVYFGSEKIDQVNNAIGGFLKYSIPVTKSIFYSNPDKIDNSDKAGFMTGPIANYKETPGFRDFLKLLDESGMEICLHTPDHLTSERKLLSEALDVTKREFFPSTWIDHGYDNSEQSNRENLVCDGADINSKWYAADLWKKYGIKYFWNSYYEDSNVYNEYSFNSFFSVPYSGWDEAMPTPLYWRNKTRTSDIIHWRTTSTLDPKDGSLWSYFFNDLRLTDLVNNRNNIIVHSYPARIDSTNGFYTIKDGLAFANEEFNQALSKLSSYRMQEKIWLTTIRDMLDYRTSLENISYEILSDGSVRLYNSGRAMIRGLTFSTFATSVKAGSKEIFKKNTGNELIFWFDIAPEEYVNLVLK